MQIESVSFEHEPSLSHRCSLGTNLLQENKTRQDKIGKQEDGGLSPVLQMLISRELNQNGGGFNKNTGMINTLNGGFRHVPWHRKRERKLPWAQRSSGLEMEGLGW